MESPIAQLYHNSIDRCPICLQKTVRLSTILDYVGENGKWMCNTCECIMSPDFRIVGKLKPPKCSCGKLDWRFEKSYGNNYTAYARRVCNGCNKVYDKDIDANEYYTFEAPSWCLRCSSVNVLYTWSEGYVHCDRNTWVGVCKTCGWFWDSVEYSYKYLIEGRDDIPTTIGWFADVLVCKCACGNSMWENTILYVAGKKWPCLRCTKCHGIHREHLSVYMRRCSKDKLCERCGNRYKPYKYVEDGYECAACCLDCMRNEIIGWKVMLCVECNNTMWIRGNGTIPNASGRINSLFQYRICSACDAVHPLDVPVLERFGIVTESRNTITTTQKDVTNNHDADVCVICFTNKRETTLVECGHIALCISCANTLLNKPCPICRSVIVKIVKYYVV